MMTNPVSIVIGVLSLIGAYLADFNQIDTLPLVLGLAGGLLIAIGLRNKRHNGD